MTGYSGTPLASKLGIAGGCRLFLHQAPPQYARLLAPLPAGVQRVRRVTAATDLVQLFATRRAALAARLAATLRAMRADAVIWVCWPKKSSGVTSELSEDVVRGLALPLGLVDVKVCAVDETWSALKLVVRKALRGHATARPAARSRALRP